MKVAPIAFLVAIALTTSVAHGASSAPERSGPAVTFNVKIAPQSLSAALQELARQSGIQIIFFSRLTEGLTTAGLEGSYTMTEAVERLLADSGLTFHDLNERTLEIRPRSRDESATGARRRREVASSRRESEASPKGIPEILVTAARDTLNLDIQRTEDDVLPYVVFDREQLQASGASSIEEFLKYRLPMNALQETYGQDVGTVLGGRSQVDLRGFGANHTLILIDGRRTSNAVMLGYLQQLDLNGISLAAVERIEVLPASASGIYGGEATGGVINIIMRRNLRGLELAVEYDDVFDGAHRKREAAVSAGVDLEDGKTNVSMTAFWSDAELLMRRERSFVGRYRDQAFANRPTSWLPPALPPLGYTTNIRSTGGSLTLDDGTALNSLFTSVPVGYAGVATDGGAALVANAGIYNLDFADSGQNAEPSGGDRVSLLNSPSLEWINAMIRREFSSSIQVFLEASASNSIGRTAFNGLNNRFTLPADAANNPFQQNIEIMVPVPSRDFITVSRNSDRRLVGGVISRLPWGWKGELDYVWHRSGSRLHVPQYARSGTGELTNAVRGDARLNPLRDTNMYRLDFSPYMADVFYGPFETTTKDVTLLLGGALGTLPAGESALSMRFEHRNETFGGGSLNQSGLPITLYPKKSQRVDSAVAELRIPLISATNAQVLAREAELQLSGRWDQYTTHGSTFQVSANSTTPVSTVMSRLRSINPAVGVRWKPVDDLMLRASYGTGFLPPDVTQLTSDPPALSAVPSTLIDPRRGSLPIGTFITVQTGGNPNLEPEESQSWSAGFVYAPQWSSGLRLSVDYTNIDRTDRIDGHPFGAQGLIDDEARFPDRIARGTPTASEAAMGWAGPITFIDVTLLNIAMATSETYDLQLDYRLEAANAGDFDFYAVGTWYRHNMLRTKAGEPSFDTVGFSRGVLEYKLNAGVTWNRGGLTLGWSTQYFDSYMTYGALVQPLTAAQIESRARLVQTQGSAKVDSQMYHDVFATYRFERESVREPIDLLHGIELSVGIRNILNTKPPRDQLSYSTYGDPRLASYYIGIEKSFE